MLQILSFLTIYVGVGSRFGNIPMYAQASSGFHGDKWFSSVFIQMESIWDVDKTCFGQVHILSSATCMH